jgi:hypothetical protein
MSELYSHLLIPQDAVFVPELDKVASFFDQLEMLGALPKESKFTVITYTGKTRVYAEDANTGELYHGPELKVNRYSNLQHAIDFIRGEKDYDLFAEAKGPTTISPFELFGAGCPDVLWKGAYSFSVHCNLRQEITHFLHSPLTCKCDLKPDEPGIFENPWNDKPIETSGLACARFWIKFGIGDWLMPMITDSLEILDTHLVATASNTFGVEFTQGCICNDD